MASTIVLVEDFLPERIDAVLSLPDGPFLPGGTAPLDVEVTYLFGAPGAGLNVEGRVQVQPVASLDAWPEYVFGRHDRQLDLQTAYLDPVQTGDDGTAGWMSPFRRPRWWTGR